MKLPDIDPTPAPRVTQRPQAPEKANRKPLIALIVLFVVIVGGGVSLFFLLTGAEPQEKTLEESVELTATERSFVELQAENFLQEAGTFGVVPDALSSENLINVKNTLALQDPNQSSFYESRVKRYYYLRDAYILEGSPAYVPNRLVDSWEQSYETSSLVSYNLTSSLLEVPTEGFLLTVNGVDSKAVRVPATLSSEVRTREMQVTDASSDGSFGVYAKGFSNESATLTLVETSSGEWKIYDVALTSNPMLLASYATPTEAEFYQQQTGATLVEELPTSLGPLGDDPNG